MARRTARKIGFASTALGLGMFALACSEEKLDFRSNSAAGSAGEHSTSPAQGGTGSAGASGQGGEAPGSTDEPNDGRFCEGVPLSDRAQYLSEDDATCSGFEFEPETQPVNIFIMMDRSTSMSYESEAFGVRWEGIRNAVQSFVENEAARELSVGLGFFGISGGSSESIDCDVAEYAKPVVEISPTAESGPRMVEAIEETNPSGWTPTRPALEGAIRYARDYYESNPKLDVVVVLVTDGYPTVCSENEPVSEVAEVAAAGFDHRISIRTFVVGLEAGFNLDSIARSGGSGTAYHIDESEDVTDAFLNRMLSLTTTATSCKWEIPRTDSRSDVLDLNEVALTFEPRRGAPYEIPKVADEAACSLSPYGGWYFSDPKRPRKVALCPCSCGSIGAGVLEAKVGCSPVTLLY